jgi:hypothetical protein
MQNPTNMVCLSPLRNSRGLEAGLEGAAGCFCEVSCALWSPGKCALVTRWSVQWETETLHKHPRSQGVGVLRLHRGIPSLARRGSSSPHSAAHRDLSRIQREVSCDVFLNYQVHVNHFVFRQNVRAQKQQKTKKN